MAINSYADSVVDTLSFTSDYLSEEVDETKDALIISKLNRDASFKRVKDIQESERNLKKHPKLKSHEKQCISIQQQSILAKELNSLQRSSLNPIVFNTLLTATEKLYVSTIIECPLMFPEKVVSQAKVIFERLMDDGIVNNIDSSLLHKIVTDKRNELERELTLLVLCRRYDAG